MDGLGGWGRFREVFAWWRRTYPRGKDRNDPLTLAWKAMRERLTPAGKALGWALMGLIPLAALSRGWMASLLVACVLALLATALVWTVRSPRLWVDIVALGPLRAGETGNVRIRMRPGSDRVTGGGAWLFRTSDGLDAIGDGSRFPMEGTEVEIPLRALRRGPERIEGCTAFGTDPFGIARSRRLCGPSRDLLVRPAEIAVESLQFLVRGDRGGEFARRLSPRPVGGGEFLGVRPWREGDQPRDLHHGAFARTGVPMAREFGVERGDGICLVYRSGCSSRGRSLLGEEAVSLAAGVARWLAQRGALGRFFVDDLEVALSAADALEEVLDALALSPRVAMWKGLPAPKPWAPAHPPREAILAVGIAPDRALPQGGMEDRIGWRLLVDWDGSAAEAGICRVGLASCRRGRLAL